MTDIYHSVNVGGLKSLTQAMSHAGVNKIIFSGSANVYGQPAALPITEEARTDPQSPYGQTKLESEHILKTLTKRDSQWSVVVLRYFNPVGAHHSGLIGDLMIILTVISSLEGFLLSRIGLEIILA